jgi:hypothetical protein
VTDEHVVLDRNPFANKRVAGDLAVPTNFGVLLNFHKRADFGVIADFAAVQIDKFT